MKTYGTIRLLTVARRLGLVMLLTVLLTMLASCAGLPASSETAAVEPALAPTAQATERAETPGLAPSPETEVTSPGYGLEGPRLVVQLPDNSIVFVSLDGQQAPIAAEAPKGLFAALAWLDEEMVLVHFNPQDESASPSLWKLKADGSEFTQIVEGNFLGVLE